MGKLSDTDDVNGATVSKIRVEPLGVELEVRPAESVMAAAQRSGYWWPTKCRGAALCTACVLEVREGATNLNEVSSVEAEALDYVRSRRPTAPDAQGPLRLACQARPCGDVVVVKRGVRAQVPNTPDASLFFS